MCLRCQVLRVIKPSAILGTRACLGQRPVQAARPGATRRCRSRRRWRPGSRLSSDGELFDLLGGEVLEEQPADAGDVGAAGVAQLVVARVGQLRVGDPRVAGHETRSISPPATRPSTSRVIPERVSIVLSASADIGSLRSRPAPGTAGPRSRASSSRARRPARRRARAGSRHGSAGSCATPRARRPRGRAEVNAYPCPDCS